jgi:hypothetical protein
MVRATARSSLAVIVAAVGVALAVWGAIRLIGVDLTVGKDDPDTVGAVDVVVAAAIGGVAAWGVHALMARRPRTERWWPFVGSTALAISMTGPSYLADGSSAVALMCLHLAVGAVLIAGFARVGAGDRPAVRPVDGERQSPRQRAISTELSSRHPSS